MNRDPYLASRLDPADVEAVLAAYRRDGGVPAVTWGPVAREVYDSLAGRRVTLVADGRATYPVWVVAYDDARRELTVNLADPGPRDGVNERTGYAWCD